MILNIFILCVTIHAVLANRELNIPPHPDVGLNIFQMVERQGYPIERHVDITTEDGYILEMHRIPYGKLNNTKENRKVALLVHGLLSSSVDWINMGPNISLGYLLVEAGYDVWLGNTRGNTWSRKHVSLDPDHDGDYWLFSWHEVGVYDLPVMIDYILEKTVQTSLYYIGHSQGTTAFWVMAAEKPEYNDKIRLISGLGPAAYESNMFCIACQVYSKLEPPADMLARTIGIREILPRTDILETFGQAACNDASEIRDICGYVLFFSIGFDSQLLNTTMIPVITSNAPAGGSTRAFLHYGQGINSKKFRKFNYGIIENMMKYGQPEPPDYDLSKITAPVALYYASNDWVVSVKDVEHLYRDLPNPVYKYLVPFKKFNHVDFLWAINVKQLLYDRILEIMSKY